jgi:CBS domain-containing protein
MEGGYTVGEVMTRNIIVSTPSESIYDCARKMAYRKISSLIIIDGMSVVGIITEQDIARKIVAKGLNPKTTPVNIAMSMNVTSIHPNKDLEEAIQLMANDEIKHLPVIENGNLLGIITSKDILAIEPVLIEILKLNNSREDKNNPNLTLS